MIPYCDKDHLIKSRYKLLPSDKTILNQRCAKTGEQTFAVTNRFKHRYLDREENLELAKLSDA
jgi:hypothetical protein